MRARPRSKHEEFVHDKSLGVERAWTLVSSYLAAKMEFTVILDGLDECVADEAELGLMMTELEKLRHLPSLRIIVSCRPLPKLLARSQTGFKVQLRGESCRKDIATFWSNVVREKQYDPSTEQSIIEELSTHPNDNFQHARMLWSSVRAARTKKRFRRRLHEFPDNLSGIYQRELDELDRASETQDRVDRRAIFLLLFGARQTMTVNQVSLALALDLASESLDREDLFTEEEREASICELCLPFVAVQENAVSFIHSSFREFLSCHVKDSARPRENLRLSAEESDKDLARRCLIVLSLDRYRSTARIAGLLYRNLHRLSQSCLQEGLDPDISEIDQLYEYAARNWISHLTAIADPEDDILRLADTFINSTCFAHWCEYIMRDDDQLRIPFVGKAKLSQWRSNLPDRSKCLVGLEDYFEGPYTTLSHQYRGEGRDKEPEWLALYRLGKYYLLSNAEKAYPIFKSVLEGLRQLLGEDNPLTLRVKGDWAVVLFKRGKMSEARETFMEIWRVQQERFPDSLDAFRALQLAALSAYYMRDFDVSIQQQQQAYGGLARLLGVASYEALCSKLYLGYSWTGVRSDESAHRQFAEVYSVRSEAYGLDDGLSLMSLAAKGQSEWILKRLDSARRDLQRALDNRLRLWDPNRPNVIDSAIHLATAHREAGKLTESQSVLSRLDTIHIKTNEYLRYCQISHLQGLLYYDRDNVDDAIALLEHLLLYDQAGNNRWLLWARLSLSEMLTRAGREDDAIMLFDKIIKEHSPAADDLASEPDSPRLLRLARDVINLVRKREDKEADLLLQRENCDWVRRQDLWIPVGGPVAEMGLMKGPWPP